MGLFKATNNKTISDIHNVLYSMSQNNGSAMITVHDAPKKLEGAQPVYLLGTNVGSLKALTAFDIEKIQYNETGEQWDSVSLNWNIGTITHSVYLDRYNVNTYFSVGSSFVFNADNVWLTLMSGNGLSHYGHDYVLDFSYETTQKKIPENIEYVDITIKADAPASYNSFNNSQGSILNAIKEKGYNNIYNIVYLYTPENIYCYKSINACPDVTWENALCNDVILSSDSGVSDVTVNMKVAVYN